MPNRLIREGLIESEAVLSLPVEARWLFVTILLTADDVGLFEATEFHLARRADIKREVVASMLSMLADSDLIRIYESGGKRYGLIPRFRQRLQIKRSRHPVPPTCLMDCDTLNKFNELGSNTTVVQPLCSSGAPSAQPSEVEVEPEEKIKDLTMLSHGSARLTDEAPALRVAEKIPDCPHLDVLALWAEVLPSFPRHTPSLWRGARADHLRARWRETAIEKHWKTEREGLDYLRGFFAWVGQSKFLSGRVRPRSPDARPFIAELEWLVKPANWAKVYEGKYHEG